VQEAQEERAGQAEASVRQEQTAYAQQLEGRQASVPGQALVLQPTAGHEPYRQQLL